jgi:hypothetical protein
MKSPVDLAVATRLAEPIGPMNKLLTHKNEGQQLGYWQRLYVRRELRLLHDRIREALRGTA